MSYLIPRDYQVNIQDVNVQQIINSDESIRNRAQLAGEAEAQSYLKQKYNISREFQALTVFDITKIYLAFSRVYINAAAYVATSTYNTDDYTLYLGNIYIAIDDSITGAFNLAKWDLIAPQYTIYETKAPYNEFSYSSYYNVGDLVIWNNSTYSCKIQTPVLDHDTALQYRTIQSLPQQNVAPDDPVNGLTYWGAGTPYSVTGQQPNDTNYFTEGDPRDAQMVLYTCDVVLYHLHARIAPRNIPELRVKRYDDSVAWFKMCAEGTITPNLPLITPKQGNRIRYGGSIKQINSY